MILLIPSVDLDIFCQKFYQSDHSFPATRIDDFRLHFYERSFNFRLFRSDEGLTLETSPFSPLTVANLRFQLSC